ncbi:hypothetical protein [Streptomyces sp. NPDC050564]|uniref:hypothetical protein n=1 Tax=Streptomyces sp. NPDC050564 TaxID=3365631 RepID=UPI0037B87BB7
MFRGFAVLTATLAATTALAAASVAAAGAPAAGDVCFWTAAGQHGSSWCAHHPMSC